MDRTQTQVIRNYSKLYETRFDILESAEEFKVENLTEGQKEDFDFYKALLVSDFGYLEKFTKYNILMDVLADIERNLIRCEVILESADWHI